MLLTRLASAKFFFLLLLYFVPLTAQASLLFGMHTRFGISSPNRSSGDQKTDPASYRFSAAGGHIGYSIPYVSFVLNGGQSRYNDERTLVPYAYRKLRDFYLGGGISVGTVENLQIHSYAAKVQYKSFSAYPIAADGVKANSIFKGTRFGAVLTGNRYLIAKRQDASNRQVQMGLGVEETLIDAKSRVEGRKRNFLSFFFTMSFSYHHKAVGGELPFGL